MSEVHCLFHSCGSSNSSLKAMKTMTPMIAAKNMAGKETVDSSMLSACSLPASLHNAIVCANRWFCWQRLDDQKAADRGKRAARSFWDSQNLSSWARPSRISLRAFSPARFAANSDLKPLPLSLTPIGFDRLRISHVHARGRPWALESVRKHQ